MWFADRAEAGRALAKKLLHLTNRRPVVLGLARGGIPVGIEISLALHAPLDVILVRKIGVPWQPELAVGAIVDGAVAESLIDRNLVDQLSIPQSYLDEEISRQTKEIERRRAVYTRGRPPIEIKEATAIVVDDGIATGASMRVALRAVRRRQPEHLVLAVPVAAPDSLDILRPEADEVVCLDAPDDLGAISLFYGDFHAVEDKEVIRLLDKANESIVSSSRPSRKR